MAETKPNKQTQKKDKKMKERDSGVKAITTALKALPAEEQMPTLLAKYAEMAEENKKLQTSMKTVERQVQVLQRDKDQMETEHTKVILAKSKLESLCRELQKQNKLIKEENLARLREEEERRKEVSTKFNVTLSEISNLMKENSDKNSKLRDENQDMATRLQDLIKQYEARETHVEKMLKQKELQCQLSEAKMAKQQIEMTEDKEKMLLEKKTLLEEVASYQKKTQQMSLNEISLRTQLNSYMEKYEDFQNTLEKSNQIFHTFKKEMEEMAKKIKKTEKDTKSWKERWEGANKALLEMVTERSLLEKQLDLQVKQNKQLQNLCRALQQQLTEIRNKDKNKPESESKDPQISEQQECALVEENTPSKENGSVLSENGVEDDASLPDLEEVMPVSEESSIKEINNESQPENESSAAVGENHVKEESSVKEINTESQPENESSAAVGENHVKEESSVKEINSESQPDNSSSVAVAENHVEASEETAKEKVHEEESESRKVESSVCNMEDVD
ncbi:alpha-taxilin-like isoform X2 [Eriocheir sinensis]|uniref:alpha-taxilin-like isoform X2 n=1 Tax=Eriocheir sinensis TaxID=95602 RepID=UPI0021C6656C|nr:alpha-taxilin-like isoform X2 [Eriocheir sinensis]